MALMIGMAGLAIDLSRLAVTQTELQNGADRIALAGAAELDGLGGAIDRATQAAIGANGVGPLFSTTQTFADGGSAITIQQIRFLRRLPPDGTAIANSDLTASSIDARFIEVTVTPRTVNHLLLPVLNFYGPAAASSTTTATAVAGFTQVVCDYPPLMICNPAEAYNGLGADFDMVPGQMVLMKTGGQGTSAAWAPGDFGLLDPPVGNGAVAVAQQLASAAPNACYSSPVELQTGQQVGTVRTALNTRFDMYENPGFGGNDRNNPSYRPARNVVKGWYKQGNQWQKYSTPVTGDPVGMGLPRATCLDSMTCAYGGGRITSAQEGGAWDRAQYWRVNHPSSPTLPGALANATRHEVYRYEIDNGLVPNNAAVCPGGINSCDLGENGTPTNYGGNLAPNDEPDRRLLMVAVVNCVEMGPITGSSGGPFPVEAFAKFFLTEPVSETVSSGQSQFDIYAEYAGRVAPGADDGVLHDIVQLYR